MSNETTITDANGGSLRAARRPTENDFTVFGVTANDLYHSAVLNTHEVSNLIDLVGKRERFVSDAGMGRLLTVEPTGSAHASWRITAWTRRGASEVVVPSVKIRELVAWLSGPREDESS